jgi:transcriptional regulator with XRE-family HTH domain
VSALTTWYLLTMDFGQRLATLRKERALTQQQLADKVGCHVTMVRRYEANETQPTLEVIRRLAVALSVSADTLVFEKDERGPAPDLLLQFEAISQFDDEDKELARGVLEGLILKHQAKQSLLRQAASAPRQKPQGGGKRSAARRASVRSSA